MGAGRWRLRVNLDGVGEDQFSHLSSFREKLWRIDYDTDHSKATSVRMFVFYFSCFPSIKELSSQMRCLCTAEQIELVARDFASQAYLLECSQWPRIKGHCGCWSFCRLKMGLLWSRHIATHPPHPPVHSHHSQWEGTDSEHRDTASFMDLWDVYPAILSALHQGTLRHCA